MRSRSRKNVLIIAAFSFVAMVTGVSLQLHLLSHEHPNEHDFEHCSLCQQLLTVPGKFANAPESRLPDAAQFKSDAVFPVHVPAAAFHHEPFKPRSPPSV